MWAQRDLRTSATSFEFRFTSSDRMRIACARWDSRGRARGVVQIAHGVGEHMGRYAETIEFLVANGLTVYANDHRGHGRSAESAAQFGDFGEGGFDLLVEDTICLSRLARRENPNLPLILLGHSMGSFAAQQYALDHSGDIDALILSGSGALDELARLASSAPAGRNILNARFEPARTAFDWLSRDSAVVDAFIDDPLCFAQLQPASASSFLAAGRQLSDPLRLGKIRDDLPIYLFSGSEDPVSQQLEGAWTLIERYHKAGVYGISHDFYIGGRHEMLNEINRGEVRERLLAWIFAVIERKEGFASSSDTMEL
jgi:alpha-beta hydrolase superfamily lysophospholipase